MSECGYGSCGTAPAVLKSKKDGESTHVRVRITQQDLTEFKERFDGTAWKRTRFNPLCKAINRTLRAGYEATFDGLSVGVVRTEIVRGDASGVPSQNMLMETNRFNDTIYHARVMEEDGKAPFYRGVKQNVQQLHKLACAHRKVSPARVTVSLPTKCLARTQKAAPILT